MNKIKVVNDVVIPFDDDGIISENGNVTFTVNGNYYIEYIDCNNVSLNININDSICINLFEYSDNSEIIFNKTYNLGKNSSLILNKFYYNENTKENVNINLSGEKSSIKYNFSSISSGADNYKINIYHLNKKTSSDIFNRTIAKNNSSNNFDINSFVENGIKDCYLNQQTKIVTLGDSNNKINPNMFIGENSTIAIHASTIGSISEDDLFYLMSRGIDNKSAVNLIIKGMILSNINPDIETREKILKILDMLGGE